MHVIEMEITLNRIIVFCRDVDKMKMFYQQYFNLKLVEEIKNEQAVLKAGYTEIALHNIGEAYKTNNDKPFRAHSNTKLVFEISNDIAHFRDTLVEKGVLVKELKSFAGHDYMLCDGEDSEGNVFQLMQRTA